MHQTKKELPFFNIGTSSLLVVFLVLCLVIFAVLTLTGAQSDYRFATRLAERRTAYYAACNQAEEKIAALDAERALDRLSEDYQFEVPITDQQVLSVTLSPDEQGGFLISAWETVNTAEWTAGTLEGI